jgi:hypothetical protein
MVALSWHCFLARNFKCSARRKEKVMGWLRFFYLLSSVVPIAIFASSSSSSIFLLFVLVAAVAVAVSVRCCTRGGTLDWKTHRAWNHFEHGEIQVHMSSTNLSRDFRPPQFQTANQPRPVL